MQQTVLNKVSMRISNLMLKSKAHAATFADPILLHGFDALRPT